MSTDKDLTAAAGREIDLYLNSLPPDERMPLCQKLANGARLALVVVAPVDPGELWKFNVALLHGNELKSEAAPDSPTH